ncbi:MAG TPA: 5,10-methylenetetrahydromethanopterin reductase [Candidatus Bathyarchaeia archaeon]|nr:5,10-methylenetetrahydromethanopterin reductase [Candidatus Bathyarchaeia archaeon]
MKIGFCIIPKWSAGETAGVFKLAEDLGFEYGWLADQTFTTSVYPVLTLSAYITKRIKLGTSVTNPYVCHPVFHANAGANIDELSNGRFILGIGAGDATTIRSLGLRYERPTQMVKESVEVIRRLLGGEKFTFEGKALKVSNAQLMFKPRGVFPIYVGGRGPKMLRLAGEIADGVLTDTANPIETRVALAEFRKGLEEAHRTTEDVQVMSAVCFAVDEDSQIAKDKIKWLAAFVAASVLPEGLERNSIPLRDVEVLRAHLTKKGVEGVASLVTEGMTEAFAIAGSPRECVTKIESMEKVGVSHLAAGILDPKIEDARRQIRLVAKKILPHFQ